MSLMKQNMSSVIVFSEQGELLIVHIETVVNITKVNIIFLIKETSGHYLATSMCDVEALDDNCLQSFSYQGLNNYPQKAKNIRDKFKDNFLSS